MSNDTWESRMAERAKQRADAAAAEERELRIRDDDPKRRAPRYWLHGYPRGYGGRTVTIGNANHCVCCGYVIGVFTVAITEEDIQREYPPAPDWPFGVEDCPLNPGGNPRHTWNQW